jgi:hypothetical protein
MLFAYFSPETTLPLASVFATVVGFILTFGRLIGRWAGSVARRAGRWFGHRRRTIGYIPAPHLASAVVRRERCEAQAVVSSARGAEH